MKVRAAERALVSIRKISRKLLSLLAAAACGQPAAPEASPVPSQMGCPAVALTYDTGVAELLQRGCSHVIG